MNTPKKLLCLLLAAALLIGLAGCAAPEVRKGYRQGREAMEEGRYADAAGYFIALEGYRNSARFLDEIYAEAQTLYQAGAYEEAADIFGILASVPIQESPLYARLSRAGVCLNNLDAAGALAELESMDQTREEVTAFLDRLATLCFEDTALIRPEYVAGELVSGRIVPEITGISTDAYLDELVYAMPQNACDSVYRQYREYCMVAFADSFADGSDSYFTFRLNGATCYVCNYYALYGGLLIKIPRY